MKPSPYVIIIENISEQIQKAVLFGGEENTKKIHYGCDEGIVLRSGIPSVTYLEILTQSIHKPFKVENTEIYSTTQQLALPICYTIKDKEPPAEMIQHPIDLVNIDGCAKTSVIDTIGEHSDIELNVLPKTIIIIKLYPSEKQIISHKLSGQEGNRPTK